MEKARLCLSKFPINPASQRNMETMTEPVDLSSILNSFHEEGLVLADLSGHVLSFNQFASEHNLFDIPIAPGISIFKLFPQQQNELIGIIDGMPSSKHQFRFWLTRNDAGINLDYEVWVRPVFSSTGNVINILLDLHDISSEKFYSNKVKRVEDDHWGFIENANAVIIGLDSQGYVTKWNNMCERITGFRAKEVFARRLLDIFEVSSGISKTLAGQAASDKNFEFPIRSKDGKLRILLFNSTPQTNYAGEVDGTLLVGQDITELVEYKNSLEMKVRERTHELQKSYEQIKQQNSIINQERKKSESLLLNILPASVAEELKNIGHVSPRHYQLATVLFADLVGFTVLDKTLKPGDMLSELSYIFTGFDLILERNHLEKIKTIGDGYLAVGGIPEENTTNPIDMVNAGVEMIKFISRVNKDNTKTKRPPWRVRIGIHSGELVAGVIGKNKFAYDVWGDTVNIASRLESGGRAGKVNISESTYQLIKHAFDCESRGSITIKNMGSINMYFVGSPLTLNPKTN